MSLHDQICTALAHAPPATPGPAGLTGWTAAGLVVCEECASRLTGRGCGSLLTGLDPVWNTSVDCTVHPGRATSSLIEILDEADLLGPDIAPTNLETAMTATNTIPSESAPAESAPAKRGPGRPRRGGRTRRFKVVMTDEEHGALQALASESGCTVADLIRTLASGSGRTVADLIRLIVSS